MLKRCQIVDYATFDSEAMNALAKFIQDEMRRQGKSQLDLSIASKVPESTLSRYVTGKVKNPRASVLAKIAQGLGVDWAMLMDLAGLTSGVAARQGNNVPSDIIALLVAEPWMLDVLRKIGGLPPGQQQAVIAFIHHLMGNGNSPPSAPTA